MTDSGEASRSDRQLVVEYGVSLDGVWLPLDMLRRLEQHGPWHPAFVEATADQRRVLLAHNLAERHNRSGLHRGLALSNLLDAIPFQPTEPIDKIPPAKEPAPGRTGR
jgi:hypothetical protein